MTATMPTVPTPSNATPGLPDPSLKHLRTVTLDTPAHVASPIDTPAHAAAPIDTPAAADPASPVPIGNSPFAHMRQKKEYQTLTRLFESFTKDISKSEIKSEKAESKGKGRSRVKPVVDPLGSLFQGLRFCIPPELGPASKHDQRWRIIASLGGRVTLQPDTAITHVIHDRSSPSILCQQLGIRSLTDLPIGCICVKWDYVARCKMAGTILPPKAWLSFPETTLTRQATYRTTTAGSTRVSDITASRTSSINRKRPETASDSDTESSKRPHRGPGLRTASALLSRSRRDRQMDVATNHTLPSGLGWEDAPEGEADGLDALISGVKNGTASDDEVGVPNRLESSVGREANPDRRGDLFKCGQAHDGKSGKGPNEWLASKFDDMHTMYSGMKGKNEFAIRQYQQGRALNMAGTTDPITSGAQAMKIKGIGQSIADRIDEFVSGTKGRQFYENTEQVQIIAQFRKIYGVGATFATELYKRGARSIDDLRTGEYGLSGGQAIGVELFDDLNTRIPRAECREIFDLIRAETESIDKKVWIEIMGSYRRGQEDSGDVDILITRHPEDGLTHAGVLQRLVSGLSKRGIITHDLSIPHDWMALEAKWMGICRLPPNGKYRRLDILCIPFEQWGAALIYFTGNEIFNRSMRLYARKRGYSLNQRGLSHGVIRGKDGLKFTEGEIIASRTEQEIFDVLGLRWRHPHHRRP
ncbi:hypothetical protein BD324DRAFT_577128 [Kockovaella imperatae]|uniref:DNA polymerase n=1 Tax=Kockovaella imperatae TaxID=4999 RepID=A0A1Y1UMV5_9TREE|nr:hypothetical protein BD324DRAFT_577128 [Kockovaella imperatae]ORX39393.1 hypothetical protein BD324DRAFT_577128 [Kockovaella imperatae]